MYMIEHKQMKMELHGTLTFALTAVLGVVTIIH